MLKNLRVQSSELSGGNNCPFPRAAHLQASDVRDHVGEQGVAGDVEGHPQAHVCWPLIQLARELTVHHVELAKGMARR